MPQTKDDFLLRLEAIAEMGQPGYDISVKTSDWENYGKSRTYLKLVIYKDTNGKRHHEMDFGYFDNKNNTYVSTTRNKLTGILFNASGSKASDDEINDAIRRIRKRQKKE